MKYIKTYEVATKEDRLKYDDVRDSYYWQISAKMPHMKIALKKIGMDDHNANYYINMFKDEDPDYEFYIFKTIDDEDDDPHWEWADLNYKEPSWRKPPQFMGKVEVDDYEVEAENYNL